MPPPPGAPKPGPEAGPAVPVDAEAVAVALEEWMVEEIKGRSARYFDLGKFLFTVSTGILLFFAAALKALGLDACGKGWLAANVVLAILGILAAIVLVWPRSPRVGPQFDALAEFNAAMARQRRMLGLWTLVTVLGLVSGVLAMPGLHAVCLPLGAAAPGAAGASAPGTETAAPG